MAPRTNWAAAVSIIGRKGTAPASITAASCTSSPSAACRLLCPAIFRPHGERSHGRSNQPSGGADSPAVANGRARSPESRSGKDFRIADQQGASGLECLRIANAHEAPNVAVFRCVLIEQLSLVAAENGLVRAKRF